MRTELLFPSPVLVHWVAVFGHPPFSHPPINPSVDTATLQWLEHFSPDVGAHPTRLQRHADGLAFSGSLTTCGNAGHHLLDSRASPLPQRGCAEHPRRRIDLPGLRESSRTGSPHAPGIRSAFNWTSLHE